jgi:two-component system nitrogen regulation sensor histidine kinase NtrY
VIDDGDAHAPTPRTLRRRMTLIFLAASLPALLVGVLGVTMLDNLVQSEIDRRGRDAVDATARALDAQRRRIEAELRVLGEDDVFLANLRAVDDGVDSEVDGLARAVAAARGLDLLTVIPRRGPLAGRIASSAHLRAATGDPAPALLATLERPASGFALVLVGQNPPEVVPSIVAAEIVRDRRGALAVVSGGTRLDAQLLDAIARSAGVGLLLETRGKTLRFPLGAEPPAELARRAGQVALPAFVGEPGATIAVFVDVARLESVRSVFLGVAFAWVLIALAAAALLGPWLSRQITGPILELADAAQRVGDGQLDVEVPVALGRRDEIASLVERFNQMVVELREARERVARAERVGAWRDAAQRVAHEIKNPLFPMQVAIETLRKAFRTQHVELPAIVEESSRVVLDEIRSIQGLVSEFSEFARLPRPKLEPTPVAALLEHAGQLFHAPPSGVVVEVARTDPSLPPLLADRAQLARVLTNLVKNAVEAVEAAGGHVMLRAEEERRGLRAGVVLVVVDDGPGIAPEVRETLFAPYVTTKEKGSGLGLSIVERIVAEHDGAIDVSSAPGRGAAFRVWIPAARAG